MRRKDCRDVLDSRQRDDADEPTEHLGDLGLGIGLNELDDGLRCYLRGPREQANGQARAYVACCVLRSIAAAVKRPRA